jgi:hypothetical protein
MKSVPESSGKNFVSKAELYRPARSDEILSWLPLDLVDLRLVNQNHLVDGFCFLLTLGRHTV